MHKKSILQSLIKAIVSLSIIAIFFQNCAKSSSDGGVSGSQSYSLNSYNPNILKNGGSIVGISSSGEYVLASVRALEYGVSANQRKFFEIPTKNPKNYRDIEVPKEYLAPPVQYNGIFYSGDGSLIILSVSDFANGSFRNRLFILDARSLAIVAQIPGSTSIISQVQDDYVLYSQKLIDLRHPETPITIPDEIPTDGILINSDSLFYVKDKKIIRYNVKTNTSSTISTFPENPTYRTGVSSLTLGLLAIKNDTIVFQSNGQLVSAYYSPSNYASGFWNIYSLKIDTGEITLLSKSSQYEAFIESSYFTSMTDLGVYFGSVVKVQNERKIGLFVSNGIATQVLEPMDSYPKVSGNGNVVVVQMNDDAKFYFLKN